jgi:hypothetical protein
MSLGQIRNGLPNLEIVETRPFVCIGVGGRVEEACVATEGVQDALLVFLAEALRCRYAHLLPAWKKGDEDIAESLLVLRQSNTLTCKARRIAPFDPVEAVVNPGIGGMRFGRFGKRRLDDERDG